MKQRIAVMLGFKEFRTAAVTIAGIELRHRIRKGQFGLGRLGVQRQAAPEVWNAVLGACVLSHRWDMGIRDFLLSFRTRARTTRFLFFMRRAGTLVETRANRGDHYSLGR